MRCLVLICLAALNSLVFTDAIPSMVSHENFEFRTREAASQGYEREFIELIELVYGKGFLSQGGNESVQNMIGDLDLNGKNILDIGSGIGGPCFYLAQEYRARLTGLEPQEWMVEQARSIPQENLQGSLEFVHMQSTSNLHQFEDASFDVILSKEVLLHIPLDVKQSFLSEIYRVLKPGGTVIIMDWMRSGISYSDTTMKMIEVDGLAYNLITPEEYLLMLRSVGFRAVTLADTTDESAKLSQGDVDTVYSLRSEIEAKYGSEVYQESLDGWGWQRDAFQSRELLTGIFRMKKHI